MQQQLKISNGYFHLWQAFLQQQNLDVHHVGLSAVQCQLIIEILAQPIDQQSCYGVFIQLIEQTRRALDRPDLALAMAQSIRPEHFGLLGYMASRSENIAQALLYVLRFNRLVVDSAQVSSMHYQHQGENIRVYCELIDASHIFLHELTQAAMVQLARQFVGNDLMALKQISFVHSAQMPLSDYADFFQCTVKFEQAHYEMIFSEDFLQMQPQQADPNLIQFLIKQAEEDLAQRTQQSDLKLQLQFIIAEYLKLQHQAPKISDIASELFVSVRTLQRQLAELGTSFKQILEQARMLRCEALLMQKLSLTHIALELGYSDQSALARAYKAYAGQTLMQKKQQLH
ncbi:AraC-like DNA-binding protein [Acinetobacter calcoaceticus]|uniref:AraC-like DNA-binding protein n=1 Tax=Acinetobacter calcoaceticus TaxID=471 RepID=A0A4R1XN71_ACICA|nr:AraC-like DNA-binding protein [Acinetobacter calcoaceticus]